MSVSVVIENGIGILIKNAAYEQRGPTSVARLPTLKASWTYCLIVIGPELGAPCCPSSF